MFGSITQVLAGNAVGLYGVANDFLQERSRFRDVVEIHVEHSEDPLLVLLALEPQHVCQLPQFGVFVVALALQ